MKVPVNSIRAGNVIEYNGKLWVASKVQHISPGKGGAFVAIEAKALRVLATGGAKREPQLADVPTTAEAGLAGYESLQWYGIVAPARVPKAIIERYSAELKRIAALPDVPTVAEALPGFEAQSWIGLLAPAGTPPAVVQKLNAGINAALAKGEVRGRLALDGSQALGGSPRALAQFIKDEHGRWAQAVRESGASRSE